MLFLLLGLGALVTYLYFLNKRLATPHPAGHAYSVKPIPDDELAKLSYPTPGAMATAAGPATGKAYVVLGGSGFVGRYIVRTLLGRGETLVRIIDVLPPDLSGDVTAKDHLSRAEFIQADVTDYEAIKDAISRPFNKEGTTAQVVIHTVGIIRAWERLPYLKNLSWKVNVEGTKNVLKASREVGTVRAFVFTSSAAVFLPPVKYLRFIRKHGVVFGDDIPEGMPLSHAHYPETKREADRLVRAADDVKGMRTGVLRPGMAIGGPGDMWITVYLTNPQPNIVWGGDYLQTILNPWDLARAHLQLADALGTRPDELGGTALAITGQPTTLTYDNMRYIMQFYSQRDLGFRPVPALPLYILSHLLESFLVARFYLLESFSSITGKRTLHIPTWAMIGNLAKLQPAMWEFFCVDYIIDDSRARKVLGYRNMWSNEQTIRWAVESLEGRSS